MSEPATMRTAEERAEWRARSGLARLRDLLAVLVVLASAGVGPPRPTVKSRAPTAEVPELNGKVAEFARRQVGRRVGNGQCTGLAAEALTHAGARRRFPPAGDPDDYAWGREVPSFAEAMPGDILQFRDAVFQGKTRLPGGRVLHWRREYPHHTAVVVEVRERGRVVSVVHQNVGPDGTTEEDRMKVRQDTLRPSAMRAGRVWIYRPVALDPPDPDTPGSETTRGRPSPSS